jgi:hypothetical protein
MPCRSCEGSLPQRCLHRLVRPVPAPLPAPVAVRTLCNQAVFPAHIAQHMGLSCATPLFLPPGSKLPRGMCEESKGEEMRQLLKSWGLTHSGVALSRKRDMWSAVQAQVRRARTTSCSRAPACMLCMWRWMPCMKTAVAAHSQLLVLLLGAQIKDSEQDAAGRPPRGCLVSAATRMELSRYSAKLISFRKARVGWVIRCQRRDGPCGEASGCLRIRRHANAPNGSPPPHWPPAFHLPSGDFLSGSG